MRLSDREVHIIEVITTLWRIKWPRVILVRNNGCNLLTLRLRLPFRRPIYHHSLQAGTCVRRKFGTKRYPSPIWAQNAAWSLVLCISVSCYITRRDYQWRSEKIASALKHETRYKLFPMPCWFPIFFLQRKRSKYARLVAAYVLEYQNDLAEHALPTLSFPQSWMVQVPTPFHSAIVRILVVYVYIKKITTRAPYLLHPTFHCVYAIACFMFDSVPLRAPVLLENL